MNTTRDKLISVMNKPKDTKKNEDNFWKNVFRYYKCGGLGAIYSALGIGSWLQSYPLSLIIIFLIITFLLLPLIIKYDEWIEDKLCN